MRASESPGMRIGLLAAMLVVAGCGGQRAASPACSLRLVEGPVPTTGEHSLAVRSSCALPSHPAVALGRWQFTFVPEGGVRGAHLVVFDKARCDVRSRGVAHEAEVGSASIRFRSSLMDWCPAQAEADVVHVYLGPKHARFSWRDVYRDVYDGRLDRVYPCGVLRQAIAHWPADGPMYSNVPRKLARAASSACSAAVQGIPFGALRSAVDTVFGPESSGVPRCPVWKWDPLGSSVDGVRVCFTAGRATLVQTAVHG